MDRVARVADYARNVRQAQNESAKKALFAGVLRDLFGEDAAARRVLDEMDLGAEKTVFNIPLPERVKTGRADTQYGTTIIEWEHDLKKTGAHAKEQLAEYLVGNWASGERYAFTLLSTDGAAWRVHVPHWEQLAEGLPARATDLRLDEAEAFDVAEANGEAFYYFLDRVLFRREAVRPTLDRVRRDFGETSAVFLTALGMLGKHFDGARDEPAIRVAFDEWRRFLAIAYGRFEEDEGAFLVHTYLSVFSKLLAYAVLTEDAEIDDGELGRILTGAEFERHNVRGFTDRDFFAWVAEPEHLRALMPVFREVSRAVGRYDFREVDEDILKGVYQELIDLETRHALGEYYTPDWLCERVVAELPWTRETTVLDPACGSGSFLRAAIARFRREWPEMGPDEIAARVAGLDIHPLSVQIAKTTVLLALGPAVRALKKPVVLRVYLANTLRTPEGAVGLFAGDGKGEFSVTVDRERMYLPVRVLADPPLFDAAVEAAEALAEATQGGDGVDAATLQATVRQRAGMGLEPADAQGFLKLYRALKRAKEAERDGLWKFIVQNLYKPFFLREQFDVVVGNPPWLTYADVGVAEYQDELRQLATTYHVKPERTANLPHLEIAAVFQSHASTTFLRRGGKMALVLPRAFLSADHHKATRDGRAGGFRLTAVWDLDGVTPLFRVPCCALFSEKANAARTPPKKGLPGYEVAGRLPEHNATWAEAAPRLRFAPVTWHLTTLGARTALTTERRKASGRVNAYKERFRQGATIVPRSFYVVAVAQDVPDLDDREVTVRTRPLPEAKVPWKGLALEGKVSSAFLYRTALAENLLPFVLHGAALVLLPLTADEHGALWLHDAAGLVRRGQVDTARWFRAAEGLWAKHRTQKSEKMTLLGRLDFQRTLTQQSLAWRYLVLYTKSAKDANAAVVEQGTLDRPLVADHVTYWIGNERRGGGALSHGVPQRGRAEPDHQGLPEPWALRCAGRA